METSRKGDENEEKREEWKIKEDKKRRGDCDGRDEDKVERTGQNDCY
jgi:hypothetical protein